MKYLAEFLSTFLLVLLGTGAIVLHEEFQLVSHFGISLTFGLAVFGLILIFSKLSSVQMNPAVTLSLLLNKEIPLKETFYNIAFQILGALMASLLLFSLFPDNTNLGNTLPKKSAFFVFFLEFGMSFCLMFVIFILNKFNAKLFLAAFLIGLIIFLEAYFGGPISGASMNPARSIGPALISQNINDTWIYIFAPITGMICSLICFKLLFRKK